MFMNSHTYRGLRSYPRILAAVTLLAMLTLCAQHIPSAFAVCANPDGCVPPDGGGDDDPPPSDDPPISISINWTGPCPTVNDAHAPCQTIDGFGISQTGGDPDYAPDPE